MFKNSKYISDLISRFNKELKQLNKLNIWNQLFHIM
jgi:hypothetical protein